MGACYGRELCTYSPSLPGVCVLSELARGVNWLWLPFFYTENSRVHHSQLFVPRLQFSACVQCQDLQTVCANKESFISLTL